MARIEAIIEEEKSYFDGKFHCMMDQNLNQLIRITQRSKDYAKTEEAISQQIQLRISVYGEAYDGILLSIMRLANF